MNIFESCELIFFRVQSNGSCRLLWIYRNFRIVERRNILWADNKRRLSCKAILCMADLVRR
jgi:hypothetical protein